MLPVNHVLDHLAGLTLDPCDDGVEIHLIPMDPVALAQGRAKGSAYRASRVS